MLLSITESAKLLELDIIVENILSFCSFFKEETLLESLVDKMTENNININDDIRGCYMIKLKVLHE